MDAGRGKLHIGIPRWGTHSLTIAAIAVVSLAASLVWNIQSIGTDVEDMVEMQSQAAHDRTGSEASKHMNLTNLVFEKALRQYDQRARLVCFAHAALLLIGLTAVGLGALRHHANEQRRREAEGEVELSHSLLRAALESTADGILVVGADRRIKMSNSQFIEMWGMPEEIAGSGEDQRALGYIVSQLVDPDQFLSKVHELYAHPDLTSFDLVEFKDGRVFERYSQPQRIGDTIHGRVWSFRDVTERKQTERELLQSLDAANAANRAKTNFLANISHEIRTPMNGVLGMTNLALQTEMDAEQRDYLETARMSAESLLSLLDQVLDISKIEAGHLSLETTDFDLRATLNHAVQMVAPQAMAKRLELKCEVTDETPDALVGDPLRLRQVLINLHGNAVKFTHEGSVALNVGVEHQSGDRAVLRVSVSDTGIGIPRTNKKPSSNHSFRPMTPPPATTAAPGSDWRSANSSSS
jgi:PAS domain S-box-containing protein